MEEGNWGGIGTDLASQLKDLMNYDNTTVCPVLPYRMTVTDHTMEIPEMPAVLSFLAEVTLLPAFSGNLSVKSWVGSVRRLTELVFAKG